MSFDPYAPYGPLVGSTVRFVTWNVWGRYGEEWEQRQAAIEDTLVEAAPDVVCLVEAWCQGDKTQPGLIAGRLGLAHHHFVGDWEQEDWVSGIGFVSRWPMTEPLRRPLRAEDGSGFGEAVHVVVDGERGPIQLFIAMLDYPLDASFLRQAQAKELARFVQEVTQSRYPIVVCGDFNAGPDSDEIRMLTGGSACAAPGLVFYDAWEVAATAQLGTPGLTATPARPSASTPTGASTTSCRPGPGSAELATRLAVPSSACARLASCSCPTITGSSPISVTEPNRGWPGLDLRERTPTSKSCALASIRRIHA